MLNDITAADVIGRVLVAEKDAFVYDMPGGTVIGQIKKGHHTAPIYSWVESNGVVYWMFDYTIPGQTPGAYYVAHSADRWDLLPIDAQINPEITVSTLPSVDVFPSSFPKWIVFPGAVIAAVMLYRILKK